MSTAKGPTAEGAPPRLPRAEAVRELRHTEAYLRLMRRHLDEALQDSEASAVKLIDSLNTIIQATQDPLIMDQLAQALVLMQAQDSLRQRVELVAIAVSGINGHLQGIANQLLDEPWDPEALGSVDALLREQAGRYVMEAQRLAHEAETGQEVAAKIKVPKIELF